VSFEGILNTNVTLCVECARPKESRLSFTRFFRSVISLVAKDFPQNDVEVLVLFLKLNTQHSKLVTQNS